MVCFFLFVCFPLHHCFGVVSSFCVSWRVIQFVRGVIYTLTLWGRSLCRDTPSPFGPAYVYAACWSGVVPFSLSITP